MLRKLSIAALVAAVALGVMASCAFAAPGNKVSNDLTDTVSAQELEQLVTLAWEAELPDNLTLRVAVEADFRCTSATLDQGGRDLAAAQFVVEVTDGSGSPVGPEAFTLVAVPLKVGDPEGALLWDETGGYFYYPVPPLALTAGWNNVYGLSVKALVAGNYNFKLYTVELP